MMEMEKIMKGITKTKETKDIMKMLYESATKEARIKINFRTRSIKINKKYLIKEGVIQDGYNINLSDTDPYEIIEQNYQIFKHSRPDKNFRTSYFKAKKDEELTDEEFVHGESRSVARAILEGYIVCAVVTGKMYWKNPEHWFWISENDEDLILKRDWVM